MRKAEYPIEPLFVERWSPRAMSGKPVESDALNCLFEAARFAPSASNTQPWRFLYARAGTPAFEQFLSLVVEGNRVWCVRAGALLVVLSRKVNPDGKPLVTHSFDAGAAWMSLALQGSRMGLVVHGMGGFDRGRAVSELQVPETYSVECMVALGYPGSVEELPPQLQAREVPSDRNRIESFCFEGAFPEV
jgi:nitroreductase